MPANSPPVAAVPLFGRSPASRGVFRRLAFSAAVAASLFAAAAVAQTYDVLKAFSSEGLQPHAGLIQGTDGNFYGTTVQGGAYNSGTIFKIDTNGAKLTTLHSFNFYGGDGSYPYSGLIQGADGNLYGTTIGGGTGYGTIFKIDTNGTALTKLHSFAQTDGAEPYAELLQGVDGNLYGTTSQGGTNNYGTIFKIDTNGSTFTTLHSFAGSDGTYPYGSLIQGTDGNLYGTTYQGGANGYGTIFKINTNGSTLTTLHSFASTDGANSRTGLIQATDGNLYGTTAYGGASGYGTIFKINANGTTFSALHSFTYGDGVTPSGLIQGTDGNLYGTTSGGGANTLGTIFKIDTNGTTFTTLHSFGGGDGGNPDDADLVQGTDGNLYGTTAYGGASGGGTIFRIDTNGSTFTTVHGFGSRDGAAPQAGLVQGTDGNLYGTTSGGGAISSGTVFKIGTNGSTFTTMHSFAQTDGAAPYAGLIQGTDGNLYGTTAYGGASGGGTIFKIDANGSTFTTLHSFTNSDGAYPYAGLIQGTDGNLYGTTYIGGANASGTVFKIDTSGSTFTTLHSFGYSDGAYPQAGLIQGTDGNLYGTTYQGGANGYGTVFKIDTNGSTFGTLWSFANGLDGANPSGGLIQAADGNLYGTAFYGGASGLGTIFETDTNGSTFTTLHSFAGTDGAYPVAGPIQGKDGNLYGTIYQGGTNGYGTIFKVNANGTGFTTVHTFTSAEGASPAAPLTQAADGRLYGTASAGGPAIGGVVFRLSLTGAAFQVTDFAPTSGPSSGGTAASIVGSGFDSTDTVSVGGVAATGVNVVNSSQINTTTPALSAGTLNDVVVTKLNLSSAQLSKGFLADFLDVPQSDGFHNFVEKIFRDGITAGYGNGTYGRDDSVTRAQMAVFLLKGEHGASYAPPPASGTVFADVPANAFAADWIEQLHNEGITAGCGGGNYCPSNLVTRAQMAVFLLSAEHGSSFTPPACAGFFQDVPCMPAPAFAVDWIEQLHAEGVTAGCSPGPPLYCPDASSTRGQMAVFLVKTFGL